MAYLEFFFPVPLSSSLLLVLDFCGLLCGRYVELVSSSNIISRKVIGLSKLIFICLCFLLLTVVI